MSRPRWASDLWLWLTDGQYDSLGEGTAWRDTWRNWLEGVGVVLLCEVFGHKAIADQCNKPEHDRCVYCMKSLPGQAKRATP